MCINIARHTCNVIIESFHICKLTSHTAYWSHRRTQNTSSATLSESESESNQAYPVADSESVSGSESQIYKEMCVKEDGILSWYDFLIRHVLQEGTTLCLLCVFLKIRKSSWFPAKSENVKLPWQLAIMICGRLLVQGWAVATLRPLSTVAISLSNPVVSMYRPNTFYVD